jgi:hypothetical protein
MRNSQRANPERNKEWSVKKKKIKESKKLNKIRTTHTHMYVYIYV